ncbi:helix-turn-helix domain-containing protein [Ponticoccus sp. SC2-23]|nr:helix-turn-helix domain-containing protein [Ponticoccus sp. SC6-9]MBM1225364.1 helix-turn-helix domain-containing protein [Ponticoccus sp. SC6-15]MBM1227547.1 helix-turn-helix domain-containing protein [Ponticoccus sp. SC6-38]MBM1234815.1 helix-turn-helix domain-containing protein [Ponticoccus sp. SC6-45]MBM1238049.1 helix-turn-helix domain-containing protein [Ponticoccus sp. SC6-49]MBM1244318.1 helix-turn-helix domain-containing protein [Ponticoccus sp. SC2-64]MBM1248339.1 helix-turn-heli
MKTAADSPTLAPGPDTTPPAERDFYAPDIAYGRFGMKQFAPDTMEAPHWHGHVEFNLLTGNAMRYDYDGREVVVPDERIVAFWAGVPHRLIRFEDPYHGGMSLTNLYMPVDTFLFMPHVSQLQVALLGGAVVMLPESSLSKETFYQWLEDDRSGNPERREILHTELNAALRRSQLDGLEFLSLPDRMSSDTHRSNSRQISQLVAMIRYILENLEEPLTTAEVATVARLHPNYASSLFAKTLHIPMKRFIIRMRLLRARAILIDGSDPISHVAEASGFSSMTQFYEHFKAAYDMSPHQMRRMYSTNG